MIYLIPSMPSCFACQTALTAEDTKAKIICDSCKCNFCQACIGLTASEVKVMQLVGKRILKFDCNACNDQGIKSMAKELNIKIDNLKMDMMKAMDVIKNGLDESVSSIKCQIEAITSTNKEMVHMLSRNNRRASYDIAMLPSVVLPNSDSNASGFQRPRGAQDNNTPPVDTHGPQGPKNRNKSNHNAGKPKQGGINSTASNNKQPANSEILNKSKSQILRGSGSAESGAFASATRRIWLSVSRVAVTTTDNDILTYLQKRFPDHQFSVEVQPKRPEASSLAFKIGADAELYEDLYSDKTWPTGVIIKRFSFRQFGKPNNTTQQWN